MYKAIILGSPHHNALGLVRSLGKKGVSPDLFLIATDHQLGVMKSKYINKVEFFDSNEDAVDRLVTLLPTLEEKVVLYASGDPISACIDRNYDRLKDGYVFFNAQGRISEMMSKEFMCRLAKEVGLIVPQHIKYKVGEPLPNCVEYPCITKAISSIAGGKSDTTICQSQEELEGFLAMDGLCPNIQIEKFIKKEIEFQFIGVSLDGGDTIVIPGHSHIDRPNGIQNTYYFKYLENDVKFEYALSKTKEFIKKTRYSGLFSVEFLRGQDGADYFLEMNFRNDGNAICVTDAGFNLPYIWYLWASGGDYNKEIRESKFRPVKYCPEYFYTMECAYGEVALMTYLKHLLTADSYTQYHKGDSPYFWIKFAWFAFMWIGVRRTLYILGIKQAPKESIG